MGYTTWDEVRDSMNWLCRHDNKDCPCCKKQKKAWEELGKKCPRNCMHERAAKYEKYSYLVLM